MQTHKTYYERDETKPGSMARKAWNYAEAHQSTFRTWSGRREMMLAKLSYNSAAHEWCAIYVASCQTRTKYYSKQDILEWSKRNEKLY